MTGSHNTFALLPAQRHHWSKSIIHWMPHRCFASYSRWMVSAFFYKLHVVLLGLRTPLHCLFLTSGLYYSLCHFPLELTDLTTTYLYNLIQIGDLSSWGALQRLQTLLFSFHREDFESLSSSIFARARALWLWNHSTILLTLSASDFAAICAFLEVVWVCEQIKWTH